MTSVTIPDGVTSIGEYAFCASRLTSVTIPDSVISIGDYSFQDCSSLLSVTIPDSVTSIGNTAFYYCTNLTSVTIPDGVTSIGEYAFCASRLTSVTIPDSVAFIGKSAFERCSSLSAFYGKFASADNRCLVVEGELRAFAPAGLTEYIIPDGVISIGATVFSNCESLTSITIANDVTMIGKSAFEGCLSLSAFYGKFASADNRCLVVEGELKAFARAGLTEYIIPNGIIKIGSYAFYLCTSLESVTIPNSVTEIDDFAFNHCYGLISVTIPNSVTKIGAYAFYNCIRLASVYCKPTNPPTLGDYALSGNASDRKIYVPTASVNNYKNTLKWRSYTSSIVGYDFSN